MGLKRVKRANLQQTEFVVVEYRIANLWHLLALGFLCVYMDNVSKQHSMEYG